MFICLSHCINIHPSILHPVTHVYKLYTCFFFFIIIYAVVIIKTFLNKQNSSLSSINAWMWVRRMEKSFNDLKWEWNEIEINLHTKMSINYHTIKTELFICHVYVYALQKTSKNFHELQSYFVWYNVEIVICILDKRADNNCCKFPKNTCACFLCIQDEYHKYDNRK